MINVFIEDRIHEKRIKYVFEYIFMVLGDECNYVDTIEELLKGKTFEETSYGKSTYNKSTDISEINIIYGKSDYSSCINFMNNTIYIKESQKLFNKNYLTPIIYEIRKLDNIVHLMGDDELYIDANRVSNTIKTNIDIISDIFFLITRYEEVVKLEPYRKEKFNRFPSADSVLFKENILFRPIVNEHIELLWSWIKGMNFAYERKKWWGNNDFAICISHDVDFILRYRSIKNIFKSIALTILRDKSIKDSLKIAKNYIESKIDYKKDPFYTFDYIMDVEERYGIKSSFYFMSGGTSNLDNFYSIEDERVVALIKSIEERGHEAGYHGSFNSYKDLNLMTKEKEALDKVVNEKNFGIRQHCLRFKAPYTWRIQEKLGFIYDTTLSFADKEGFRCGTCFPFKPYDILTDKIIDIWEIPLVVMDTTLMEDDYSAYTPKEAFEKIISLVETVKNYGGVFSLLWHNSSLNKYDSRYNKWILIYENLMEYLGGKDALKGTGKTIIDYLRS